MRSPTLVIAGELERRALRLRQRTKRRSGVLRILAFSGTPVDLEGRFVSAGSKSYDQLIRESLDPYLPSGVVADYFTLRVADGERLPQGLGIADFDGVWISGSPFNAYKLDQLSVRDQIELAREIWDKGIPAFGSCRGLQLMTAALGGDVRLNPNGREVGVARRIYATESGRDHDMLRGKAPAYDAICVHEDEVATHRTVARFWRRTLNATCRWRRYATAIVASGACSTIRNSNFRRSPPSSRRVPDSLSTRALRAQTMPSPPLSLTIGRSAPIHRATISLRSTVSGPMC